MSLTLTSPGFEHNTEMPKNYTCDGPDVSPPLHIHGAPDETESFVLIMDDPDAPDPQAPKMVWDHWVVWNIAPTTTRIEEDRVPVGAIQGRNSWGRNTYGGPCPPIGRHRYFFKLYALDTTLELPETAAKQELERAMAGHVLDQSELIGLYQRS